MGVLIHNSGSNILSGISGAGSNSLLGWLLETYPKANEMTVDASISLE